MKRFCFLFVIVILESCSNTPEQFIPYLEGYWEISEVTLTDGTKKIYTYNDTIDYISVSDSLTGFRKKLKPNLMGSYETSKDVELLSIKIENDSLHVYYQTPYAQWKETVLMASNDELLILNKDNVRYLYKRFQPLDLSHD
jgi:hypothetical protein